MTERVPPGLGWERWIDRQIRAATERGEFEHLPGAGKPIPDLNTRDEMWWFNGKLQSEGLTYQPPSLALRKATYDALEAASQASSEAEVRQVIERICCAVNSSGNGDDRTICRPASGEAWPPPP